MSLKYTRLKYLLRIDPIPTKYNVHDYEVFKFTNPADHTEILKVVTQVHTCEISAPSYRSHPVNMYRSHTPTPRSDTHLPIITDTADHTIVAGHANPPINMC